MKPGFRKAGAALVVFLAFCVVFVPVALHAAGPIDTCGSSISVKGASNANDKPCQFSDLVASAGNFVNFLINLALLLTGMMWGYVGFKHVVTSATSNASEQQKETKFFW